jgi:hypothetical protein
MTYGDSIVSGAREAWQTRAGLGVRRVPRQGAKPLGQRETAGSRGVRRGSLGDPSRQGGTEDGDQVQHALLTDGRAFEVDAGDADREIADGLWRRHGRRRVGQEQVALREGGRPGAIGEEAEVANADEAVGDDEGRKRRKNSSASSSMTLKRSHRRSHGGRGLHCSLFQERKRSWSTCAQVGRFRATAR